MTPIVIFAFNRPNNVSNLIDSLKSNPKWDSHPVTVYCDGPPSQDFSDAVMRTRTVVRAKLGAHAKIIERSENLGLAKSIISGVNEALEKDDQVIVLEDDLILSPAALSFFEKALLRYRDEEKIMHVSGYFFPVQKAVSETFFYRECSCWGWATWRRAWAHFIEDSNILLKKLNEMDLIDQFNVVGTSNYYKMLLMHANGHIDSWAIRWYASVTVNRGLSIYVRDPVVKNEGFDGFGVNCGNTTRYDVTLSNRLPQEWPTDIVESEDALAAIVDYRRRVGL